MFDGETGMYAETDATGPINFYGETKLMAEHAVQQYPFNWSIVRTVMVYGKPLQNRQNLVTSSASALQKGERLRIFNDQVRTPTYVEDLAHGIVRIIEKNATGIYHLSGEQSMTLYEMIVSVARYLQLDASLITSITENDWRPPARRPHKTGFDISKARLELGFQPVSFGQGLEKTFGH